MTPSESAHVGVLLCFVSVCTRMHGSLTRVSRRHFAAISHSRDTSGAQPCDDDGNGLACNCGIEGHGDVGVRMYHL